MNRSILCRIWRWGLLLAVPAMVSMTGCRVILPEPPCRDVVLADFEKPPMPEVFSDRDELAGSKTTVRLSMAPGVQGNVLRMDYNIGPDSTVADAAYGGFSIRCPNLDATRFGALAFDVRLASGGVPDLYLQLVDARHIRKKASISRYLEGAGKDWTRVRVPLALLTRHESRALTNVVEVAFVFGKGKGAIELNDVTLEAAAPALEEDLFAKIPYPARSKSPLPEGLGAWCYGDPEIAIAAVTQFNASASSGARLVYLFPYAGEITFKGAEAVLTWEPEKARAIAEGVGDGVQVHPMIDGLSSGAQRLTADGWDRLAKQVADAVNAEPLFQGIHLDIEPHDDALYELFARIKKYTSKPLTVSVGSWTTDTFRYADMVVLMAYDWASTPEAFGRAVGERIPAFLAAADEAGGKAMIGVPAIATHHEYESMKEGSDGALKATGFSMSDYVKASLNSIRALPAGSRRRLNGLCIWALHPSDGLHGSQDSKWYYPSSISEDTWRDLRAFD